MLGTSPSATVVTLPAAFTSETSPVTKPVSPLCSQPVTVGLVSGVPSYGLLPLSDTSVTVRTVTFSVPSTFFTLVKFSVLSSPLAFRILKPSLTLFSLWPTSVWLPLAVASTVKPSGRPVAVTFFSPVPSQVSGVPS